MSKGSVVRRLIIILAFVASIVVLIPERSVDISTSNTTVIFKVLSESKGFKTQNYHLICEKGGGEIGEAEDISLTLYNDSGDALQENIQVGSGYTPSAKITLGNDLPDFSFSVGKIESKDRFDFSAVVSYMNLGLDLVGGSELVYSIPVSKQTGSLKLPAILDIFRKKLNNSNLKEIFVQAVGENRILVQLPGLRKSEVENIKSILEKQGKLEFRIVRDDEDLVKRARELVEKGKKLPLPSFQYEWVSKYSKDLETGGWRVKPGTEILVESKSHVTGQDVAKARVSVSSGIKASPAVSVEFTPRGQEKFGLLTERNKGRRLAIILDGHLQSAPKINGAIYGTCEISGDFSKKEVRSLVTVLQSGSLDIKPELLSENTVGPTLGSDSIRSGLLACLLGGVLVFGFIAFYYQKLGLIACFGLFLNVLMLGAAIAAFGGTLTLPGIAGFALTIGMAVDASILIFERLREESEKKQHIKATLTRGFDRAFVTIFDSNFTTFITAFILYVVGNSAPVEGFCLSLMVGLIINLFTAVFVTQTLLTWAVGKGVFKEFKIKGLVNRTNFDFFSMGKFLRLGSLAIILSGLAFSITRGKEMLDVDFTGGQLLQINLNKAEDIEKVRSACKSFNGLKATVQYSGNSGQKYTIRSRALEGDEKSLFLTHLREQFGNSLPTDDSAAFPLDSSISGVAANEMLYYAAGALVVSMFAILLYIMMRFSQAKYGLGACVALIHDVCITLSILAIMGQQINLTVFAALLTVVGYSLNDTIVIFDRIRENIGTQSKYDLKSLARLSLNQTLSRTLLTSITTLFVVLSLVFIGGGVIKGFAITMLIGLITGTYSSLYIAVPFVLFSQGREDKKSKSDPVETEVLTTT